MQIIKGEQDFYTSVIKSLKEIDPNFQDYGGVLVVGSHTPPHGALLEETLKEIREARNNKYPLLGICMGMQLMIIEYARNVLLHKYANSTEIDPATDNPVVEKLPDLRVGIRPVSWHGKTTMESHWHNYAFNKSYLKEFQEYHSFDLDGGKDMSAEWEISFTDGIAEIMQIREKYHPFYVGIQFHPEYQSSKQRPHKVLKEFLEVCKKFTAGGHRA